MTTTWSVSGTSAGGTGTSTGAFAVAAGSAPVAAFADAYTRSSDPVTTTRTVMLQPAAQTATCRTARTIKRSGTSLVVLCPPTTVQGGAIGWGVTCLPRGLTGKGDVVYCRAYVTKAGVLVIRTYGYRLKITVRGKANAIPPRYQAWTFTRVWYT